jgi:predicted O-methyltransferase YrrM
MMQIPPRDMNDPAAHALVDQLTSLFTNRVQGAEFEALAMGAFQGAGCDWFQHAHGLAMIMPEILVTLAAAARSSRGTVLEIGPYVGASTLSIIIGLKDSPRPFFTIESGGTSEHPTRGSDDILRDLKANLDAFGVRDRVHILEGWAHDVSRTLPNFVKDKVGLLFIDADGSVDIHINNVKQWLAPDCLLVFDDWKAHLKGDRVRRTVNKLVERGAFTSYGVLAEATWFGRLNGEQALRQLSSCCEFEPDIGHAYWGADVYPLTPSDNMEGDFSNLELFEDGKPLGPAHSKHKLIREQGRGAYSHWRGQILFSASDNSDPRTNGGAIRRSLTGWKRILVRARGDERKTRRFANPFWHLGFRGHAPRSIPRIWS